MYTFLEDLIFYACWVTIFLLCYYIAHYHFKYCIPATLYILKFLYAISLLLMIRLYYLLRIQGNEINWEGLKELVGLLNITGQFDL